MLIATTAPIFMLVLTADRKYILRNDGRTWLWDAIIGVAVVGLTIATLACGFGLEDGLSGREAISIWYAWGGGVVVVAGIYLVMIAEEATIRIRTTPKRKT